jgi:hypothetical protein
MRLAWLKSVICQQRLQSLKKPLPTSAVAETAGSFMWQKFLVVAVFYSIFFRVPVGKQSHVKKAKFSI